MKANGKPLSLVFSYKELIKTNRDSKGVCINLHLSGIRIEGAEGAEGAVPVTF